MQRNIPAKIKITLKTKIILIIFGLSLFFVFLEVGLRLGGFILLSMQEYRNSQSIKQKGGYRIMCLGESTTQGQYPQFLEPALNQRNIGVRFSVVDKGRGATNTSTILSQVEPYLAEYHPDIVVTMMGINDWGEHIPYEVATTSKTMLLIRSFRTYKLTRLLWLHILTKAREIGLYKSNEDSRSSRKVHTYLPGIELKEAPTDSILTADSFKKAIELNPKNDNAYLRLGLVYRDQGKLPQAADSFKKAIELNPKNDNAYLRLGLVYRDQGKLPQAKDSFKKAIDLNPKNDNAYFGLGLVYRDQNKLPQAADSFKKAIELNPKNDNAYFGLGLIYRGQSNLPQAKDSFKKAIEFNPKNDYAYFGLGTIYRDQNNLPQAKDSFKKAIELNPKNDKACGAMSVLYEETGKPKLAKEYTQKVNRLRLEYYNPVTVNNYHKLKEILDKRGIRLVCVQYPMRSIGPLKRIFKDDEENIIFVDNESVFKEALKKSSCKEYFKDMFGGDFGHCTPKGNRLLGENIANVIIKEIFHK